jgi:hypothetical protein
MKKIFNEGNQIHNFMSSSGSGSTTLVNSFLNFRLFGYFRPVSTTPGSNFIAGVNGTAEKLFAGVNDNGKKTVLTIRQQYLRPPGSDAAADGVIGTTMKRRIHRHPKRPD